MNRIIAHIDMNSYFASVEQQANPFLIGKPVGVAGKGSGERTVVAAASREAKKFGIKSGFSVWEAQKLCPHIILVPADYSKYQDISTRIIKILENYSDTIEIFSIDEAFFDLTYICDKNWEKAQKTTEQIKLKLKDEVGEWLTASVGLAPNKLMAKLASESKKPDGLTIIKPKKIKSFLQKHNLDDLCGIGSRIKRRLFRIGIYSLKDLENTSLEKLRGEFGHISGTNLWNMARGIDNSPVTDNRNLPQEKSFGHSYTLPKDLDHKEDALAVLYKLAERACRRARMAKMCGRSVGLFVRFNDFTGFGTQKVLPHYINTGSELFTVCKKLLLDCEIDKPIRLVGVSLSSLINESYRPIPLWQTAQKKINAQKSIDKIQDKYGDFTIYPATISKIIKKIQNIPDGRDPKIIVNALMKRYY